MAKQKIGMGRGLNALIAGASDIMDEQRGSRIDEHAIVFAPIDSIIPNPRQPRRVFREDDPRLLELSKSIKEHGLLQPLVVTQLDNASKDIAMAAKNTAPGADLWFGATDESASRATPTLAGQAQARGPAIHYQIIAGERRWRAARLAGLTAVPVVIKEATPQQMLELALIENIQRADLNPIEEALAYQALIQEFHLTQETVARQVGKDRSTITNALRLLSLAPRVREALINQVEHFSEGHARALAGIAREDDQVTAMGKIITLKLNVRQAEELAARIKALQADADQQAFTVKTRRPAELVELESQFRNALMVKVDLKRNTRGKGAIVLHFNNQDELERLYNRLVQ